MKIRLYEREGSPERYCWKHLSELYPDVRLGQIKELNLTRTGDRGIWNRCTICDAEKHRGV